MQARLWLAPAALALGCFVDPGLSSTSSAPPDPDCYYADFAVDPVDWQAVYPGFAWEEAEELLAASTSNIPALVMLTDETRRDVKASVRIRLGAGGSAGLFVRLPPGLTGPYVYVELGADGVARGFGGENQQELFALATDVAVGAWAALTVECVGDTLNVTLDGESVGGAFTISGAGAGYVGLAVTAGDAEFDDVMVCPAE